MEKGTQITFHSVQRSEAIEQAISERIAKLEQFYPRMTGCRVAVDAVARTTTGTQVKAFEVRIDLTVPGEELVARHTSEDDLQIALREAFSIAERELKKYKQKQRRDVKPHVLEAPVAGEVAQLFPDEQYGFIRTLDGRDVYFHAESVTNTAFEQLSVGSLVHFFFDELGDKGPHANHVMLASPHAPHRD
jgi:ribosomal subunit interface protein